MSITQHICQFKASLPQGVALVAVSKFHPAEAVMEAYNAGQRMFGESRVQELTVKRKELPEDIEWHFIGSLQRNKVKDIAPFIDMIHSIDSVRLLQEVHKQAEKNDRIINVLLEVYVAQEETKHGFSPEECKELLQQINLSDYPFIRIRGLMGMATYTENTDQIRKEFHSLQSLFTELKSSFFKDREEFTELSMGMSHDYTIAIEEGSTMIRIGTTIFGEREY